MPPVACNSMKHITTVACYSALSLVWLLDWHDGIRDRVDDSYNTACNNRASDDNFEVTLNIPHILYRLLIIRFNILCVVSVRSAELVDPLSLRCL